MFRPKEALAPLDNATIQRFMDLIPEPCWIYDPDSLRILEVNSLAVSRYGFSRAAFLQKTIIDIRPDADAPRLARRLRRRPKGESPPRHWRHITADGTVIDVEIMASDIVYEGRRCRLVIAKDVTERLKLAADRENRERLFAIAEEIGEMGSWEHDIASDALYWSDGALRIFGLRREEFQGRPEDFMAQVYPEDRPRLLEAQAHADQSDGVISIQYRIMRPDGEMRVIRACGQTSFDNNGHPVRRSGVMSDVTKSVEAAKNIEEANRLVKIAGDMAKLGGWRLNTADGIIAWSDEACAIYEITAGERLPLTEAISFFAPAEQTELRRKFDACTQLGEGFSGVFEFVTASGRHLWVRLMGVPVRGVDGRIVHVQGAIQDVTDQIMAERTLEAGVARFRQLAESMPQIVWTATAEGVVDYANAAFYAHTGLAPQEFRIEDWVSSLHPDDVETALENWTNTIANGQYYSVEFRIRRRDGAYRWHRVTGTPIVNDAGRVSKWFGSAIDIHEEKEAAALARLNAEKLETTLETISDGFIALDKDCRFTYVNKAAEKIFGASRSALLGYCIWNVFNALEESIFGQKLKTAQQTGEEALFEFYYPPSDAFLEVTIYPSKDGVAAYLEDMTEERRNRSKLRLLEASIANLNDVVIVTDAEKIDEPGPRILFVNEAFARMTGYAPEEVIGQTPRILQGPKTQRAELDRIRAAISAGEPVRAELINYKKSGEEFWNEIDIAPLADSNGVLTHLVAVQRDITDKVTASDLLRQSEARFRAASNAIADVVWDWDLKTDTVWWSEGYTRAFGLSKPSAAAPVSSWTDHIHPKDLDRVLKDIHDCIHHKREYWEDHYRFRHADGSYRSIYDRGYLLLDDLGEPARFVGGMADETERETARANLEQYAHRLDKLARITRDITSVPQQNETRLIERIASTARALVNADGAALVKVADDTFVYAAVVGMAEGKTGYKAPVKGSFSGLALTTEETLLCTDTWLDERIDQGAARDFGIRSLISTVLPGSEGPIGVLEVMSRRTDAFSEDDARLIALHAQSAGAVLQRLYTENRLRRSQRLEAIGHLTGGVAHDFNNLLTVILGNAEVLTRRLKDFPELAPLAEMTQTAAERGAELTNRLLAFARQQPLDPKPTDLSRLIDGMSGLVKRTLGEHIEIETVLGESLWPAMIDAPQLESAILNLCINARDAMPEGGKLMIELANTYLDLEYSRRETEVKAGQYVLISISDTGCGMPPDVLENAFEPFFTTKDESKGSGLGLSMVFGFIKQSEGHIKIYSEVGQGTSVKLYLPRAGGAAAYADPTPTSTQGGSEKILLVEDDDLVRGHVLGQLRSLGYKVIEARNAREALEAVRQIADFDLLFTDVVMPGGMTGKDLADAVQEMRPALKVLFTSGYTENAIVHHGRLDPGVHFISKPFRLADLDRKMREALSE